MALIHKSLAFGRWRKFALAEQMGHIGSEVFRLINCRKIGDEKNEKEALWRALELIGLTIADKRWKKRLLEICRLREILCDLVLKENIYKISLKSLQDYFLLFALNSQKNKK